MASTIAELTAGQAIMTDQCLDEAFEGQMATAAIGAADRYRLVLLNLALGALTLTQAGTAFWDDLSDAETVGVSGYTKGTGISLTGANLTAIAAHMKALDFAGVSLDDAEFTSDAYAIVRATGTLSTSPVLLLGKWDAAKTPAGTGTANFTATIVNLIKFTAGVAA